jgi:hypothetical protein
MTTTYWAPTIGNALPPLPASQGGTGGTTPLGWLPGDDGFGGFDLDPAAASGGGLLTAGTAYLSRLPMRAAALVSNLWVCVTTAGAGASTGCFGWIVSGVTGAVLAQSADVGAIFTGAPGWVALPMTVPVSLPAGTNPYAVILCNLATTQVTLLRALNTTNNSLQTAVNLAALRWAQQAAFGTAVSAVNLAANARTAFSNVVGWS